MASLSQRPLLLGLIAVAAITAVAYGQALPVAIPTDLDAFMSRVLARRDENYKKLQQYVLDERERFELNGPDQRRIYGFQRDYTWFIRQGYFVRSPLRADGVPIGEGARKRYETQWVADQKRRETRRAARSSETPAAAAGIAAAESSAAVEDIVRQNLEPQFVQAAYFLRFKFEPGRYGLVGREAIDGRDTLRIEYYPQRLFREGRTRPDKRLRDRDDQVEEKMNKASLVTLWVEPVSQQILKFTFDNVDWDFLPGRALARVDSLVASMRMTEAFPSVWLPRDIQGRFALTLAVGTMTARYDVEYHDYKQAEVTYKVK